MLGRVRKVLTECLFPIFCVQCGLEGAWWCQFCREENKKDLSFFDVALPLNGLMAIFSYQSESPVGKLIQQFKYNHSSAMAELWREILPTALPAVEGATVVPVPLYPRRERERGYNQAKIIGQILADKTQLSFAPNLLKRIRATRQQAKLSRREREENVRGAFVASSAVPKNVILVDDVFTTGATMAECALALRVAGAQRVLGFVLAKGERGLFSS